MQSEQIEVNNGAVVIGFPEGGKRVKADVDDGYTKLANELLEAICKLNISGRKFRVFMAIIRKTYGFKKKVDRIPSSQIAEIVGCSSSNARHDVVALKTMKLIVQDGERIGPNPVISDWITVETKAKKPVRIDAPCVKSNAPCVESDKAEIDKKHHEGALNLTGGCVKSDAESALNLTHSKEKRNISKEIGAIQESLPIPTDQQKSKTKPKGTRKKPGKPIDPDFWVSDDMRNWFAQKEIPADLNLETEKFVNYHTANGTLFADWRAAWRNWMLNAKKYAAERGQSASSNSERRKLPEFKPVETRSGSKPTHEQRQAAIDALEG